jgi:hypothetical protein
MVNAQYPELYIPYRSGKKWGVANKDGKIIINPKFEKTFPARTNRIRFKKKDRYGYLNLKGKVAIKPTYTKANDFIVDFEPKPVAVVFEGDSSTVIDTNGNNSFISVGCLGALTNEPNGLHIIHKNGKYGIVDYKNDTLFQAVFKHILNPNDGPLIAVQNFEDYYALLSIEGDTIYPFRLNKIDFVQGDYSYSYFKIIENGKMGIIDMNGKMLIEPKYDFVKPYKFDRQTLFSVWNNKKELGFNYNGIEFWDE